MRAGEKTSPTGRPIFGGESITTCSATCQAVPRTLLKLALQKTADVVAVDKLERCLAHGVVAARKRHNLVLDAVLLNRLDD